MEKDSLIARHRSAPIREEAALWFARMRGEQADSLRPAFDAWLARNPRHRVEYNRLSEVFAIGAPETARRGRRRVLLSAAALAAAAAALLLPGRISRLDMPISPPAPASEQALAVRNGPGEIRTLALSDGSRITLDSTSRIVVRFDGGHRTVLLYSGRARFDVAHDKRPFSVIAGTTTVTDRGTLFDVILPDRRPPRVALIRGSVDVDALEGGRHLHARLVPGQEIMLGGSGTMPPKPIASTADIGWPDAVFDYDSARLDHVVADANRFAVRPIVLASDDIGVIHVSGHFRVSDSTGLAEQLATVFDLTIDGTDPAQLVLSKREREPR